MTNTDTNGSSSTVQPSEHEREIAAYLAKHRAERNEYAEEVTHLKAARTGDAVKIDELETLLNDAKSRAETAMLVRDQAVARRAELETVLASILSLLRTFQIAHEPMVKPRSDADEVATIGGA